MRRDKEQVIKQIIQILTDNHYTRAKDISEKLNISTSLIFSLIKKMRLKNIGILTTNKGYVLAEFANKVDDVNFMRRLYGRRTSDFIALKSCESHIEKRWKSIEEKRDLKMIISPLSFNTLKSEKGMKLLLSKKSSFEK